jgi:hypothetical protein
VPLRAWLGAKCRPKRVMERVAHREAVGCVLGGVYGAQELHELVIDLGRGFVLYPVAHIIDFGDLTKPHIGLEILPGRRFGFLLRDRLMRSSTVLCATFSKPSP